MAKTTLYILFAIFMAFSCQTSTREGARQSATNAQENATNEKDTYFQYSIWWAFVNKVFDGDLKVKTLKQKGDIGLGSFDFLDGEMVMLKGIPYRITEDGMVSVGLDNQEIVYANATFFEEDGSFTIQEPVNFDGLRANINENLPSHNFFYAFKIHGTFKTLKLGGLFKQRKPFEYGLDVLIPNRPVFEGENITGTMVGFYCPEFIGNINVAGYHFHFISDDLRMGGHVMEFETEGALTVPFDKMSTYEFMLPDNADFENVTMDKEFQYQKN